MKIADQIYFWVAEAVTEHDDTQKNLALRLGISEKHLSEVMQRKARLSPEKLDHLAIITGRKWAITFERVSDSPQ